MKEHYYHNDEIFGENWFSYPNLYKKIVKKFSSGSKFVEVGCWKGRSAAYMAVEIANSGKDIEFYCVDTWEGSIEHKDDPTIHTLYETFLRNMKPVENYYFPLRITSKEASSKFKDASLDFVFLDGSHEYADVKLDIQKWLPKVKPGGILAGHDYYVDCYDWFPGVKQAVNEELSEFETSENCFIYEVPYKIENKLKNFPSINFISMDESADRQKLLYKKFKRYGLKDITPHIFKRYDDSDHVVVGNTIDSLLGSGGRGPVTSHLKAIKEWYFNTDEEYTFFCEDDLSFETVEYWNFSWNEFFNKLPSDWECVQLCWIREEMFRFSDEGVKLRPRCWCDWSACAYLIKRSHAKKLISQYYRDGIFILDYIGEDYENRPDWALRPVVETIIFSNLSPVYGFPLFVEDTYNCTSSINIGKSNQINCLSHDEIINWWKNQGKHFKP